uniref:DnaJ-like protein subfamily B member 13 n=1 Tax=Noccaea caerulescens TaxID=107243 RepID=A0A1J3JF74_NOCCA
MNMFNIDENYLNSPFYDISKAQPRSNGDDIFGEFFGFSGGSSGNKKKAAAIESKLACTLEELYKGASKKIRISRVVLDVFGNSHTVEEILKIDLKPGWKKGTKITFQEKGNQAPGVIPADLIFVVDEKPHSVYKRDGNDLIVEKKISLLAALTGLTIGLTTLDGRNLNIPVLDIVKPGQEIVIPNEGMPTKDSSKRGDLRINFEILFPSRRTSEQKNDLKRALA